MITVIAKKEIQLIFKDKSTFFWMFALPIVFIVIFASIFGGTGEDRAATIAQIVPGYTVMFVFFIMITMVQNFLRERESGMLARLRGTPMKQVHFLIGMWIPHIVVLLIQSTVLLGFGVLVYDLQLGNLFVMALLLIALAICSTGMGLLLSVMASSLNMGIGIVQIVAMGGAIIGGLWFPTEMMPELVQSIGKFTPQYWALQGMQEVILRGGGLTDVMASLGILLGIGVLGLLAASAWFPRYAAKG